MSCDVCKYYNWYYDYCRKWDCKTDRRAVHNCYEKMTEFDHVLDEIAEAKNKNRKSIIVSATIKKDTIRKLLENGYRVILCDSFNGSCEILVSWDAEYEPRSYWDDEFKLENLK